MVYFLAKVTVVLQAGSLRSPKKATTSDMALFLIVTVDARTSADRLDRSGV
jgi:hypothetical protein